LELDVISVVGLQILLGLSFTLGGRLDVCGQVLVWEEIVPLRLAIWSPTAQLLFTLSVLPASLLFAAFAERIDLLVHYLYF